MKWISMLSVKKYIALFLSLMVSAVAMAQDVAQTPEMADAFRRDGKIYVVIAVVGLVFVGLAVYLVLIDRKVSRLEKQAGIKK
ncbi:MAG: CcmD family protein [Sphingobacteriales bacterium JAD_PAG50586_3]|nr:MAG: CcmD family protein [Sphingobacteriales bacterium JAD_PAG50586_3]